MVDQIPVDEVVAQIVNSEIANSSSETTSSEQIAENTKPAIEENSVTDSEISTSETEAAEPAPEPAEEPADVVAETTDVVTEPVREVVGGVTDAATSLTDADASRISDDDATEKTERGTEETGPAAESSQENDLTEPLLDSLGKDTLAPLVDEVTDAPVRLLEETVDVVQSRPAQALLGETLEGVARLTDGVPVVAETVHLVDSIAGDVVVPVIDETLHTVGQVADDSVTPLADQTLAVVDGLTREVVAPLVDDTLGAVGRAADGLLVPVVEDVTDVVGLTPLAPIAESLVGSLAGTEPAQYVTDAAGEPTAPRDTIARPDAFHWSGETLPVAAVVADEQVRVDSDTGLAFDDDTVRGGMLYDGSGAALAGTSGGSAATGAADIAHAAIAPTATFLTVQQAHAAPGLLDQPSNPGSRPD